MELVYGREDVRCRSCRPIWGEHFNPLRVTSNLESVFPGRNDRRDHPLGITCRRQPIQCSLWKSDNMASGADTRGQVGRTMAGVDGVEIKATIPQQQVDLALQAYGLELDDNERYIYFFDTPELTLFQEGVIARARGIVSGQHDRTIKFRPIEPTDIPGLWRKYNGFKLEADASEKGVVKSASLTMAVGKGMIKRVAAGKEPIASLFTEEQILFLLSLANKKYDYSKV